MAEPRLLHIGKRQSTLDVLAEELRRFGRDVLATNDRALIGRTLGEGTSPATALSFANEQVVLCKVLAAAGRDQSEG